jgi:flavin reductase (DIM6/NTAB) family NADH-FMN oxidoreductase RutF
VVTTVLDGVDHAMTANAFASVSLDPLLVLVCAERRTRFHDAVLTSGSWAVSVLGVDDERASKWFATKGRPLPGQLDEFPHHRGNRTGAAILDGALSAMECTTWATYPGGDHTIVVGQVVSTEAPPDSGEPLLYFGGLYHGLGAGNHQG